MREENNVREESFLNMLVLNPGCVSALDSGLPGLTSVPFRSKLVASAVATWVYVPGRPPRGQCKAGFVQAEGLENVTDPRSSKTLTFSLQPDQHRLLQYSYPPINREHLQVR